MENSFSIFIFKLNENVKLHFILLTNYFKNHLEAQNYYDLKKKSGQKRHFSQNYSKRVKTVLVVT